MCIRDRAKINLTKFTYVKAYKDDRTAKVEEYMSDLMAVKYSGIQEIYDEYYAWHVSIVANTSEDDNSSDVSTVKMCIRDRPIPFLMPWLMHGA